MLHIHRAARADALAAALAQTLAGAPADPFTADVVAVPTRGMERWLTQMMSARLGAGDGQDGVCANILFPTPHRLLSDAVAVASKVDPDVDPWRPERLTWPLLEIVEESLAEPWLGALRTYLGGADAAGDPLRRRRRLSVVRHLAGLYDRYALHRPAMLAAWLAGRHADAAGAALPEGAVWQAELWRRLNARIAMPGPAQRREDACARVREEPGCLELPERLSLFGLTRIAAGHLDVLRSIASGREVHLFALHPSPALWDEIARRLPAALPAGLRRAGASQPIPVANRLLASWGRDSRELQLVLAASAQPGDEDTVHPIAAGERSTPLTLLARLQADVRDDRAAPGTPLAGGEDGRALLERDDMSVRVHACHGRQRQVEVLRDAILHALADDPTLEPRDVIVMCPDVEAFAPLIQATFAAPDPIRPPASGPGDLRIRLADRSLTQTNGLLGVVSALLELVDRRVTASEVLDLADRAPVRRRFGLGDDDLTRLGDWIAQSGIRWGLDADHRAAYKLGAVGDGTWRAGLDRILLGVAMTEDGQRRFGDVLPLDDVESRSVTLAGTLAELIARLQSCLDELGESHTLTGWGRALAGAVDALAATAPRERWRRAELQRILDEMVAESGDADGPRLAPTEIRAHLAARLAGRPTRANFRTGHLTVCTLMPMRSVPHRVVCLLGLDDGEFPRRTPRDGDDLMLSDPHLGERDPRSEDRQLLLDALLACTERLVVTYTGNDERTNTPRPPAVPVGELLDAVDDTVRTDDGTPASTRVAVRHPLQPFDPRNFSGDAPWSFDAVALAGARALTGPRAPAPPFLPDPLPAAPGADVDLDDLVAFVQAPVRAFLRQRLGISLRDEEDDIADELPIDLDGLERWGVANRLLEAQLRGISLRHAVGAEKVRGTLPPGALGDSLIDGVKDLVIAIATTAAQMKTPGADRDPFDIGIDLGDDGTLTGSVAGVNDRTLLSASFSRVAPRHRIAAWVRWLALTAAHPHDGLRAATIGRGSGRDDVRVCLLAPGDEDPPQRARAAREQLLVLVDLYRRGMREPLPIFPKASSAWAQARRDHGDAEEAARAEWETRWYRERRIEGEGADLSHQLVLGGQPALAELLTLAPAIDEAGPGWAHDEPTRVGRLARRYWDGLAHAEQAWSA